MKREERLKFLLHARTKGFGWKMKQAEGFMKEAFGKGRVCVSVSMGKDSIALIHLAATVQPEFDAVHVGDELEDMIANFSEVRAALFANHLFSQVTYHHLTTQMGGASVPQTLEAWGLHERYEASVIGLRVEENGGRIFSLAKYGPIHQYETGIQAGLWRVCPLIYWSWMDVWAYIVENDLPYLSVYDHPAAGPKSTSRTSSVTAGRIMSDDPKHGGLNVGRMVQLQATAPEYYNMLKEKFPHVAAKR